MIPEEKWGARIYGRNQSIKVKGKQTLVEASCREEVERLNGYVLVSVRQEVALEQHVHEGLDPKNFTTSV